MKRSAALYLVVLATVGGPSLAAAQSGADLFQQAIRKERVDGDLKAAIVLYQRILKEHGADRALSAKTLVQLGQAYETLGNADARSSYQRVLREYADQSEPAAVARTRLTALSVSATSSYASEPVVRRIWSGDDVDPMGAPTRDGKLLTFVNWFTGDLAVRDLTTGEKRHLTSKGSWASPTFALFSQPSPDGRRVAYAWVNEQAAVELRLIGMEGGESRLLYSHPEIEYFQPSDWSPDGKEVLVQLVRKDHVAQIALIRVADGSVRVLKTLDWRGAGKMSFSPDGKFLVYDVPSGNQTQERDIYVLATDGSTETTLVRHPSQDFALGWSPDGQHVVFASDRTGGMSVWLAPVANGKPAGEPVLVRRDAERAMLPMGFTQSGTLYFGADASPKDMYIASIDPTANKTAAPSRLVEHFVGTNHGAEWSRDRTRMVYVSQRQPGSPNGAALLIVRSVDTGAERIIPTQLTYLGSPRWSPEGDFIVAKGRDQKGRQGLFRVDPQSGDAVLLVAGASRYMAGWSADGRSIVYRIQDVPGRTFALVRQSIDGSDSTDLLRVSGKRHASLSHADVSPDGRQVVFTLVVDSGQAKTLQIVPTTGGEARQIYQPPADYELGDVTWSGDGRYIVFVESRVGRNERGIAVSDRRKMRLMRLAVGGGAAEETGVVMDNIQYMRRHPDGQRVAFTAGLQTNEVWAMENFLPKPGTPTPSRKR